MNLDPGVDAYYLIYFYEPRPRGGCLGAVENFLHFRPEFSYDLQFERNQFFRKKCSFEKIDLEISFLAKGSIHW